MERTLQLVFLNLSGNRYTMSIPEPQEELEPAAVEAAMDQIIAADVVVTSGGGLVNKVRATVVTTEEEDILEF